VHPQSIDPGNLYRPDIDGLRAVAVIAVLGFHASLPGFEGGFAGVDAFFVISGYLISGIIFRALDAGTFSLPGFYVRRINRIFPALLVILFAVIAIGWVVLFSAEWRALGGHVAAAAGFVSNFILEREAGYFASEDKPLLHLWSLAVEEQFYLIYPAIAILAWKIRRFTLWILAALAAASFLWSLWSVHSGAAIGAFYFPFSRFWELLAGALLYELQSRGAPLLRWKAPHESLLRNAAAWFGAVLILAGAATLDKRTPWPGLHALLPVGGTVLLIAAGRQAFINRSLLSHPSIVGIGLISYPLYLWHFPLLVLATIVAGDLSPAARLGILAISGVLAVATYKYVEIPIRFGARKRRSAAILLPILALVGLTGLAIGSRLIEPRVDSTMTGAIEAAQADFQFPNDPTRAPAGSGILFSDIAGDTTRIVLFIGDSHAEQYWPRMSEATRLSKNDRHVRFVTRAGCAPLPYVERRGFDKRNRPFKCAEFARFAYGLAASPAVTTVVLAAWWEAHLDEFRYLNRSGGGSLLESSPATDSAFAFLERDVARLRSMGKSVYIVLSNPTGDELDPAALLPSRVPFLGKRIELSVPRELVTRRARPAMDRLRKIGRTTGAIIIDPVEHLCSAAACPAVGADGLPIYKDNNHIRSRWVRANSTYIDAVLR
jgi:peptidoglycan/LPS O-acetylase OafA/YrhL